MQRKRINFDMTDEEHKGLKMVAVSEGKTIKDLIYEALDRVFPHWRSINSKLSSCKNQNQNGSE